MAHSRREFVLGGLSAGAALPLLGSAGASLLQASAGGSDRILVVMQIDGGWDYFNQIVPVYSSEYYAARPVSGIGIRDKEGVSTLAIDRNVPEKWAIAAKGLKELFDRGDLAVINRIGYPEPNLSHFESQKRWYTGSPAPTSGQHGWLGAYLRKEYQGDFLAPALDLSLRQATGAFDGARVPQVGGTQSPRFEFDRRTAADNGIEAIAMKANAILSRPFARGNLREIAATTANTFDLLAKLESFGRGHRPRVRYPYDARITPTLYKIAGYVTRRFGSHLLYMRFGGFDNHGRLAEAGRGHVGTFASLLGALAGNLAAFLDDVKAWGRARDVVVLVFSEFGRRFGVNGSQGTDHGHGGVAYLAGEPVRGGWYGKYPDLSKATRPYADWWVPFDRDAIDFRRLYATVLERWLGADHRRILGQRFSLLPIL